MKEGIIQKVFSKVLDEYGYNTIQENELVLLIQQELIKEIRKEFSIEKSIVNFKGNPTKLFCEDDIKEKLIGETKE